MYLKSMSVSNFRKFGSDKQVVEFAHGVWKKEEDEENVEENNQKTREKKTEEYISKSSTLMVGKNNSGKTTILSLLKILQDKKCGSQDVFKYTDFNLNVLRKWYDENIVSKTPKEINSIAFSDIPTMDFNLIIGIDDENDVIGKFEDILQLRHLNTELEKKIAEKKQKEIASVNIEIKYEVNNEKIFLESLSKINTDMIQISQLELTGEEIKDIFGEELIEEISTSELREKNIRNKKIWDYLNLLPNASEKDNIKISELRLSKEECKHIFGSVPINEILVEDLKNRNMKNRKIENYIAFYEEVNFRKYLQHFCGNYYILNFYPEGSTEPAKEFSLAPLLKVRTIDANNIKDGKTLTNAYNKIVTTYMKNNQKDDLDIFLNKLNFEVKTTVDDQIIGILQDAVSSIESTKNLKMNLKPDITLPTIFNHSIIYEYKENENYIPENQFGLGYTNLMVIISEIVDYIGLYGEDDINGAINILGIEEPESFMHPQMQELFIKNISKAIAKLLGKKNQLDTFQIILTTHSSSILNSKIHSANTLDNIAYLGCHKETTVQNIKDNLIVSDITEEKESDKEKIFEYIKKYLRIEASDVFFADAVILVEGVTEETYIRYLIDNDEALNRHHIKVYRIDGAYAHQFVTLLDLLKIKTIIYTDLDLNRKKEEKKVSTAVTISNINDKFKLPEKCITTNEALKTFIMLDLLGKDISEINDFELDTTGYDFDILDSSKLEKFDEKKETYMKNHLCNAHINKLIGESEKIFITNKNFSIYSQGKINGNYATSFEESIILSNVEEYSLWSVFDYVFPKTKYLEDIKESDDKKKKKDVDFIKDSYKYQIRLSKEKSKFSTGLIFLDTSDSSFNIKTPDYIESGLEELREYFKEGGNE